MLNRVISYYKSCYEADFRTVSLLNFFGKKVESSLVFEDPKILLSNEFELELPFDWFQALSKKLVVYAKEKELFCSAYFLAGSTTIFGKKTKIVTPLFLIPAQFTETENSQNLDASFEQRIINPAIFQIFNKDQAAIDLLKSQLSVNNFKITDTNQLIKAFKEFSRETDISQIENFTKLFSKTDLKALLKPSKNQDSFQIVPAFATFVMNKSKGSRGVINELEYLPSEAFYSKPLQEIFTTIEATQSEEQETLSVPIILSKSQRKVLQNAYSYDLSLVIGPPGTGKSFTIAALAVEFMTKGKSVLIASKNNQAGKVIADKIENDFGLKGIPVRAGKSDYKELLQKRLENWLSGMGLKTVSFKEINEVWNEILTKNESISNQEQTIKTISKKEGDRGEFLTDYRGSFFQKIKMYFLDKRVKEELPLWKIVFDLEQNLEYRNDFFKQYIQLRFYNLLNIVLSHSRSEVQRLVKALKARTGVKKEDYFSQIIFSKILKALPIWVTCATDIHKVLPLDRELFDLVIIDEATQCDIASSIPLLQRAKKAVIVGDPKQLRHLSFVSGQQLEDLENKHELNAFDSTKLDYRNSSILDLVSSAIGSQNQVSFLNEHFRSMPDIIDFSNQKFYEGNLHIMTAQPKTLARKHAFLKKVNGKRNKTGYNKIEAESIIDFLNYFFEKEEEKPRTPISIGIVSPFSEQVAFLQKLVSKTFPLEVLQKHQFLIGTPFSFQGEEKDIMLIEKLKNKNLAAQYLHYLDNFKSVENGNDTVGEKDIFMQDVLETIQKTKPDKILVSFPIAGIEIDLVVLKNKKTYCIDLIGHPGTFSEALTLERWRMLERVGLRTFFLPYSQWYFDRRKCQKALIEFLDTEMLLFAD